MNRKEIEALALEAAKSIKTEQDLNDSRRMNNAIVQVIAIQLLPLLMLY